MKPPSEPTRPLPCGCVLGLYSEITSFCDHHYQTLLDERFLDEPIRSLRDRICEEEQNRAQPQS